MFMKESKTILLFFSLILLIAIRFFSTRPSFTNDQQIRITTHVTSEPIIYETAQGVKVSGLVAYIPVYPAVGYGDKIVIEGTVENGKLINPKVISINQSSNLLIRGREKVIDFFSKSLPSPHWGLIAGIVLGSKKGITGEFWEDLKATGTAHVVVASGMNVAFLAGFVMNMLLNFVPRPRAASIAIASIWLYAILSGFDAPIVRASIMGSITFAAMGLGRVNLAGLALLLSACVMLIVNPDWLFDLGFILSFAATGSLILFENKISTKLSFVPKIFKESLATSLAAQIGVAPILLIAFGQVNLLSPFINALILWMIPAIMIIGSSAALISLIYSPLATIILYLVYPLTLMFVSVVDLFS